MKLLLDQFKILITVQQIEKFKAQIAIFESWEHKSQNFKSQKYQTVINIKPNKGILHHVSQRNQISPNKAGSSAAKCIIINFFPNQFPKFFLIFLLTYKKKNNLILSKTQTFISYRFWKAKIKINTKHL